MLNRVIRSRTLIFLFIVGLIILIETIPKKTANQALMVNSTKLDNLYPINNKDFTNQEQEPDNTTDEAFPLQPGQLTKASFSSSGDQDFYRINISNPTNLIITLTNLPKKYELKVIDPNLQVIGDSDRQGFTNTVSEIKAEKPGKYYIEMIPQFDESNQNIPYSIEVDSVPQNN